MGEGLGEVCMNKDTIMDFIEWLEEEKNIYLVDLYYPDRTGTFDNLDDVRKLVEEYGTSAQPLV